ncbi:unnamed protein product [Bemisia tabaci]|uniref:GPI ethanolamine phosphate transferase 3 n=1 Tax=Bemisia tabaci TaxID=7038 RepID=A0A9P0A306_BEMTA|nr:unnamed protein product [Bemisia tabaci]
MYYQYVLFLAWIAYMLICSILLFTRGFLLNRQVLPSKSSCAPVEPSCSNRFAECLSSPLAKSTGAMEQKCLFEDRKAIIILIDALRFDFLAPQPHLNQTFHNHIPVVGKLLVEKPDNARLFEFIADPPTTTMQRLKGLTTGSLPTFIDISSNFASAEIDEDNIIDQLVTSQKPVIFMGDDTWINAFPNRFHRQRPFPSFNVWDLDSVDIGIRTHLIPEMKNSDWRLLIAHFVGVDHCGHRYGPYHPEMVRKLTEMNSVIEETIQAMDNNTVLFVLGDHGMTATGDHGGDSDGEVKSAMFVYSPKTPLMKTSKISRTSIKQIDLVPTLAAIFGIPIPFSNLGSVVFESLPIPKQPESLNFFKLFHSWNNVKQVTTYIKAYAKNSKFSAQKFDTLEISFEKIQDKIIHLDLFNSVEINSILHESQMYLEVISQMCRELWVQFDANSMSRGLVLTFLTLSFALFVTEGLSFDKFTQVFTFGFYITRLGLVFVSVLSLIALKHANLLDISNVELAVYFVSTTLSILLLAMVIVQNWVEICQTWYKSKRNMMHICYRFIFILSSLTMFSNSFVVEEYSIILFLSLSLLSLFLWENRNKFTSIFESSKKPRPFVSSPLFKSLMLLIGISIVLRLGFNFNKCREEQGWCLAGIENAASKDSLFFSKTTQCVISIVSLVIFIVIVRNYLKMFGNFTGFSPTVLLSQYLPTIIVICLSGYWLSESTPLAKRRKLVPPWHLLMLPRIVFSLLGVYLVVLFFYPTSIHYLKNRTNLSLNSPIPHLFQELKNLMKSDVTKHADSNPIIFGLATVYSSSFINFSSILCLLSAILLGFTYSVPAIFMVSSLILFAFFSAIIRNSRKLVNLQLFNVGWPYVIFWGLSSIFWFYGTGHQATFPSINWNAAFIGISSLDGIYIYLSALLVTGNTFISYIVHAALLPLLLIIPFTLEVTFPSALSSNDGTNSSIRKGDVTLFENEPVLYHSVFSLCCKYMIFHGFRVFMSMFAAVIHSRHLMVWKIFAPKFMFEGLSFIFFTIPSLFVGFFLVIRITNKIEQILKQIDSG